MMEIVEYSKRLRAPYLHGGVLALVFLSGALGLVFTFTYGWDIAFPLFMFTGFIFFTYIHFLFMVWVLDDSSEKFPLNSYTKREQKGSYVHFGYKNIPVSAFFQETKHWRVHKSWFESSLKTQEDSMLRLLTLIGRQLTRRNASNENELEIPSIHQQECVENRPEEILSLEADSPEDLRQLLYETLKEYKAEISSHKWTEGSNIAAIVGSVLLIGVGIAVGCHLHLGLVTGTFSLASFTLATGVTIFYIKVYKRTFTLKINEGQERNFVNLMKNISNKTNDFQDNFESINQDSEVAVYMNQLKNLITVNEVTQDLNAIKLKNLLMNGRLGNQANELQRQGNIINKQGITIQNQDNELQRQGNIINKQGITIQNQDNELSGIKQQLATQNVLIQNLQKNFDQILQGRTAQSRSLSPGRLSSCEGSDLGNVGIFSQTNVQNQDIEGSMLQRNY